MTRKPTTTPHTNHSLRGSPPRGGLSTFRPSGPVPADRDTDWIALKDAIDLLSSILPGPRAAADWMLRHITSGEVPITCRLLTYRQQGRGLASCERHEWPGREARLAEQIEQAVSHPLSGFRALPGTVDFEWLDVTGDHPVDTRMSFPHVDRAALVSYFPKLQEPVPAEQAAPIDNTASPGNPQRADRVMREFTRRLDAGEVARSIAAESRILAAWHDQTYQAKDGYKTLRPKTIEPYIRPYMNKAKLQIDGKGDGNADD